MTNYLMLILTFGPSFFLIAGTFAVAAWARRMPEARCSFAARLVEDAEASGSEAQPIDWI